MKVRDKIGKYKAKMRYRNEWVYGKLVHKSYLNECIDDCIWGERAIETDTICKETGILDKKGASIFIGDIVTRDFRKGLIIYKYGEVCIQWKNRQTEKLSKYSNIIVLGNKFD